MAAATLPAHADFVRGDCNDDGRIDIYDVVNLLVYLDGRDDSLDCLDACDADDNGRLDTEDAIYQLTLMFSGGAHALPPFPKCGLDPTADALTCDHYAACPPPLSHTLDIQQIWNAECVSCHSPTGSGFAVVGLDLSDEAYWSLVDVESTESHLPRVAPYDPEGSYLWHKLRGSHLEYGSGEQMPFRASLDRATFDRITRWILEGANP